MSVQPIYVKYPIHMESNFALSGMISVWIRLSIKCDENSDFTNRHLPDFCTILSTTNLPITNNCIWTGSFSVLFAPLKNLALSNTVAMISYFLNLLLFVHIFTLCESSSNVDIVRVFHFFMYRACHRSIFRAHNANI